MKRFMFFVLFAPSWAMAQDPVKPVTLPTAKATVTPGNTVPPGVPVTIDATDSTGDDVQIISFADPSIFKPGPDRIAYLFTLTEGTYYVTIDAASIVDGKIKRNQKPVSIVVQSLKPVVPPVPVVVPTPAVNPVVAPDPPITPVADTFGLIASTRAICAGITWNADQLRYRQTTISQAYLAASRTSAASVQEMETNAAAAVKTVMGAESYDAWKNVLMKPIRDRLKPLTDAGTISTQFQLSTAFAGIAAALGESK